MSIHASGMDHLLVYDKLQVNAEKKHETLKKSDLTSILDIEDDEIESLELEENEEENGSFHIFSSFDKRLFIWKKAKSHILNTCKHKHNQKIPLFIQFENYRL